jgi:23S rRNA (adenine2503-C2)-methyltransferase
MTNLPRHCANGSHATSSIETPAIERRESRQTAPPSSCSDSGRPQRIEAVYIPDTPAQTFCISTQVGCAMACAFCLTGKMGLARHLTADEIAGQVRVLAHDTGLANTPSTSS